MKKQVVLITGASSGIGKATAEKLVKDGHIVYGAARRTDKMKDLRKQGIKILRMDVSKEVDVVNGIDLIIKEQGRINVLYNNAGFGLYGAVEDVSLEDARYQFDVNLFGLAHVTQMVLPHMRKQGSGKIINTSSIGGKIYTPLGAWYHATKHAVEGWSDCLRIEVKQFGIDVVVVEPGVIQTSFGNVFTGPMMKSSGKGPYRDMAMLMAQATETSIEKGEGSSPNVIAEVVSKAIKAKKPKTRYAAGKLAKPLIFMRKTLSDKMFDRIIMSQMK